MDLRSIYIANGVGIFILLILLYVSRARIARGGKEDRLFAIMLFGVLLGCCMEALSFAIDGHVFTGSILLNYIANTYLSSANLLLSFSVLAYVDLSLYDDVSRIWKHYKPQIVVGAILIAANVVNYFVPITYVITDQNVYERRPLLYVYYIAILYYLATAFLLTRRYEKENGTRTFVSIPVFLIPIVVGAGLQFAFYGLSLAWLSSAVGLAGLFMMQQNELAYIDSLVDTYNRQYLNYVLASWTAKHDAFAGVMFDVDGFKEINDSCGHAQGDAALKAFTDILKSSRTGGERVFRYAGDEFIVLKRTESPDDLTRYLDNVEEALRKHNRGDHAYTLAASYGVSSYAGDGVDAFIGSMDAKMYKMKEEHHRANPS